MLKKYCLIFLLALTNLMGENIILRGSGATFPYPLYKKWIDEYTRIKNIQIIYDPVGSGQGIKDLVNNRVDFGGTDVFLKDKEIEDIGFPVLHVPTCIGAIVFTYNLPVDKPINLSKETLLKILTGKITNWNNHYIKKENPDIKLPDQEITFIHRSDDSGSTYVLTNYLCNISNNWKKKFGYGKNLQWDFGVGVEGNENIAKYIRKIKGSIGYISFAYAKEQNLPIAKIENRNGNYILPTVKTITKAAEIKIPDDVRIDLINSVNKNSYPICTFSYIIFSKTHSSDSITEQKIQAGKDFFRWMLDEGQKYNKSFYYAPVPQNVVEKIKNILD